MFPTYISIPDIQSCWEVPCIALFCSSFHSTFNLPEFDIEEFENGLLVNRTVETTTTQDSNKCFLPKLIIQLLKGCDAARCYYNNITISNYQIILKRFFRFKCKINNLEDPFDTDPDTDTDFLSLPLRKKLLILHMLCEFRLESRNVLKRIKKLKADSLRVEPLGYDEKGSAYWYFYGTRLYREDLVNTSQEKETENSILTINNNNNNNLWQVICFTEEDWNNLINKFKKSNIITERALYNTLIEDYLPNISELFKVAEHRRRLLQVRSSSRISAIQNKIKTSSSCSQTEIIDIDESLSDVSTFLNNKNNFYKNLSNENDENIKLNNLRKNSIDAREKRALRRLNDKNQHK